MPEESTITFDAELLGLLNASLDADFALRDRELAKEVERAKNEMTDR